VVTVTQSEMNSGATVVLIAPEFGASSRDMMQDGHLVKSLLYQHLLR
jgi:hypothetical protein